MNRRVEPRAAGLPVSIGRHVVGAEDFDELYERVTATFVLFRDSGSSGISAQQRAWLDFLIAGFRTQYERWPEQSYRELVTQIQAERDRNVKLAGFVYLHISYDLSLVVAQSLGHWPGVRPDLAITLPERAELREIFLRLESELRDKVAATSVRGFPGWLGRRFGFVPLVSHFVASLRNAAWIRGEILHDRGLETHDPVGRMRAHYDIWMKARSRSPSWSWSRIGSLVPPTQMYGTILGIQVMILAMGYPAAATPIDFFSASMMLLSGAAVLVVLGVAIALRLSITSVGPQYGRFLDALVTAEHGLRSGVAPPTPE